jgi:hypothetical protein
MATRKVVKRKEKLIYFMKNRNLKESGDKKILYGNVIIKD